jgi:small-conductance mechanosensitive channel
MKVPWMPNPFDVLQDWLVSGQWIAATTRGFVAVGIVLIAVILSRLVGHSLRRLRDRTRTGRSLIYVVEKLAGYALVMAGVLVGVSTLGIDLTSLAVFAGAVGVGVGLGLQGVVREFVSGLVAIFDPFVNVGDFVELEGGVRGEVTEIGPRATRLRTNDGLNVIIPNSKLIETQVVNWTLKEGGRRIHVPFSVAYGADKSLVRDVVLAAAKAVPFTLADTEARKTQVWLIGFGDSALNFELIVWPTVEAVRRPAAMQAAYTWAIEDALREAGVEIPFPQVDLRLRTLFGREGDDALRTLDLAVDAARRPSPAAGPTANDAAETVVADALQASIEHDPLPPTAPQK